MPLAGAFRAIQKNGRVYYRSSFTYKNKHISLGSYLTEVEAHEAYLVAKELIRNPHLSIATYRDDTPIDFDKFVSIINFRDNNVYFHNPIYLYKTYFQYYLSPTLIYKFDIDDLFYYAEHKISRRNGHLFLADYGSQVNFLARYGIRSHAVAGRDYIFLNGDSHDFSYDNIQIINRYNGVHKVKRGVYTKYMAKILVNGTYTIGTYDTEEQAAIAYNKAADIIKKKMPNKNFRQNYVDTISAKEYVECYSSLPVSARIMRDFG